MQQAYQHRKIVVAMSGSGDTMELLTEKAYISLAQTYKKGFGIETLHCPRSCTSCGVFREQNALLN